MFLPRTSSVGYYESDDNAEKREQHVRYAE